MNAGKGGSTVNNTRFLAGPIHQHILQLWVQPKAICPFGVELAHKVTFETKERYGKWDCSRASPVPRHVYALACLCHISYTSDENVMRGLGLDHWFGTHSSSVEAKAEIDWLAASATALCIVDLVGLMSGFSMFKNSLSLLHICLHFFGSISVCWFILYSWHYKTFWYSFIGTNIIPSVAELLNALALFCCKTDRYYWSPLWSRGTYLLYARLRCTGQNTVWNFKNCRLWNVR